LYAEKLSLRLPATSFYVILNFPSSFLWSSVCQPRWQTCSTLFRYAFDKTPTGLDWTCCHA